ncbi:MAG TPA: DUF4126 domain-containing protein [Vicinamibacterales bacterium]
MKTLALLGTTLGFAFSAGLNLYATVLVIGLAVRVGWVALPGQLSSLAILGDPIVLGVAGVMYVIEFLADKIPAVDHAWDLVHTFIRPIGAAWIAWRTIGGAGFSEPGEVALLLAAGGVALSAHAGKAGTRLASASVGGHVFGLGVLLSLAEDVIAFVLTPLAMLQPLLVLAFVLVALCVLAAFIPLTIRAIRRKRRTAPTP